MGRCFNDEMTLDCFTFTALKTIRSRIICKRDVLIGLRRMFHGDQAIITLAPARPMHIHLSNGAVKHPQNTLTLCFNLSSTNHIAPRFSAPGLRRLRNDNAQDVPSCPFGNCFTPPPSTPGQTRLTDPQMSLKHYSEGASLKVLWYLPCLDVLRACQWLMRVSVNML